MRRGQKKAAQKKPQKAAPQEQGVQLTANQLLLLGSRAGSYAAFEVALVRTKQLDATFVEMVAFLTEQKTWAMASLPEELRGTATALANSYVENLKRSQEPPPERPADDPEPK